MVKYEPPLSPAGSASAPIAAGGQQPAMLRHPAAVLGALGAVSGVLSAAVPGPAVGTDTLPANLGLYMVLAGFWFGLVTGFGVFRYASATSAAVSGVLLGTWLAWEVAVNVAVQLDENVLEAAGLPEPERTYISGFIAGEVGAVLTWAAAAWFSPRLRQGQTTILMGSVGALFGLLLPLAIEYDTTALLFVPWQAAVAATFGWFLAQPAGGLQGS